MYVYCLYRPIPFEDVLTILVSIFPLSHDDERKVRESMRLTNKVFDPNGNGYSNFVKYGVDYFPRGMIMIIESYRSILQNFL